MIDIGPQPSQITGLVLAGGRARRFGGADKGLLTLHGVPLAVHALARLRPQVGSLLLNVNRHGATYRGFGVPLCSDAEPEAFRGPLAGMAAGLQACATPWLLTVPCDGPHFPLDLAIRLGRAVGAAGAAAAIARAGDRRHPVYALLSRALWPDLIAFIAAGHARVDAWMALIGAIEVDFDTPEAFANVNTPEELRALDMPDAQQATPVRGLTMDHRQAPSEASGFAAALADRTQCEPAGMRVEQARDAILQCARLVPPTLAMQRVPLRDALGRVLAVDVVAPLNVPAWDNSGMDGYALCADDLGPDGAAVLRAVGSALAGHAFAGRVERGTCVRIMTGAVMPAACDTVIPQELCQIEGDRVTIPPRLVRRGDNVRQRGEDLRANSVALPAGRRLRAADIGLLASLGCTDVEVRQRLRVAVLSSGDELRSPGDALDSGSVYDSNRHTLRAMLDRLGCDVLDLGVIPDDPDALAQALRIASARAHVVITSGGASAGEADHLRRTLQTLGDMAFWRIAMRPGRPMAFGRIDGDGHSTLVFGLPGNPVAVMVTFYMFVREALLQCAGTTPPPLPMLSVVAAVPLRKRAGRTEYQRGRLCRMDDGRWSVELTGDQGSGILRSMSEADGIIVLSHDRGAVEVGEVVDFLPFEGLA